MTVARQFWERILVPWIGGKVDDELIGRCESYLKERLPESFVALYRTQNGGIPAGQIPTPGLFALADEESVQPYTIRPLSDWVGDFLDDEDIEWISEALGDPDLLLPIWREGNTAYALNFNHKGPDGEPNIVWLDIECGTCSVVAESFASWWGQGGIPAGAVVLDGQDAGGNQALLGVSDRPVQLPGDAVQNRGGLFGCYDTTQFGGTYAVVAGTADLPANSQDGTTDPRVLPPPHLPQEMQDRVDAHKAAGDRIIGLLVSIDSEEKAHVLESDLREAVAAYEGTHDRFMRFISDNVSDEEIVLCGLANTQLAPNRAELSFQLSRIAQRHQKAHRIIRKLGQRLKRLDIP